MADLNEDQLELKQAIQKSAMIWGIVLGVVIALILYWILGGQTTVIRVGGAVVAGAAAGFGIQRWIFSSRSKSAQCAKCGAAFSITRVDHKETQTGSEDKVEREPQDDGSTKVTRFSELKFDVVDSYKCASCGDVTTKNYTTTRRENEQTKIDAAPNTVAATGVAPAAGVKATATNKASKSSGGGLGRGGAGSSR